MIITTACMHPLGDSCCGGDDKSDSHFCLRSRQCQRRRHHRPHLQLQVIPLLSFNSGQKWHGCTPTCVAIVAAQFWHSEHICTCPIIIALWSMLSSQSQIQDQGFDQHNFAQCKFCSDAMIFPAWSQALKSRKWCLQSTLSSASLLASSSLNTIRLVFLILSGQCCFFCLLSAHHFVSWHSLRVSIASAW